jgi:ubiquinone/menaquinone biosynthesis C-methylase UbiE
VPAELNIEEIENLGYYDFMGYLGVPFFNVGGHSSIDRLAEMCHITKQTKVLEVGCGTGGNACYLAEKYGCTVVGVDIAELMVRQAIKKAEERGLTDRVSFRVGDAYRLDFPDAAFDSVVTVFVSQFLDPARAYLEFQRVLTDDGCLGINEMYCAEDVPTETKNSLEESEKTIRDLTDLPFTLHSPATWRRAFESAGFTDVILEVHPNANESPYSKGVIEEFGEWLKFAGTIWRVIVYALKSGKIRKKYASLSGAKQTMLRNKTTNKYIGYVIGVGRKILVK